MTKYYRMFLIAIFASCIATESTFASVCISEVSFQPYTFSAAIGNLNGDAFPDFVSVESFDESTGGEVIRFGGVDGSTETQRIIEPYSEADFRLNSMLSHVTVADFDGDGYSDLVLALGRNLITRRNNGSGSFGDRNQLISVLPASDTVESYAQPKITDIATADVDGDGRVDIVVSHDGGLKLFLNDGAGQFTFGVDLLTNESVYSVATADLDGNGLADIVIGLADKYRVMYNVGKNQFSSGEEFLTSGEFQYRSIQVQDLNLDGRLDLILVGSTTTIALRDGDGFKYLSTSPDSPYGLFVVDIDSDGDLDLVPNQQLDWCSLGVSGPSVTWRGDGKGNFIPEVGNPLIGTLFLVDVNQDGNVDEYYKSGYVQFNDWILEANVKLMEPVIDVENGEARVDVEIENKSSSTMGLSGAYNIDFTLPKDSELELTNPPGNCADTSDSGFVIFLQPDLKQLSCEVNLDVPVGKTMSIELKMRLKTIPQQLTVSVTLPTTNFVIALQGAGAIGNTVTVPALENSAISSSGNQQTSTKSGGGSIAVISMLQLFVLWMIVRWRNRGRFNF